ncbi:hypothetical protein HMPREF1142_0003 [Peptostreptococcaceae bacterium AS15]|nr:hypothetical protein HMPREF1142_0003 [Peptostreptococcaceae bacterium AS15]
MEYLYKGLYLDRECGNNAFSYNKRKNKKIYIPPMKKLPYKVDEILNNLIQSDKTAFSEYDEILQKQYDIKGIENFIYCEDNDKKLYIFDNHNHSFYFIAGNVISDARRCAKTPEQEQLLFDFLDKNLRVKKNLMIHFDQHKDMRVPDYTLSQAIEKIKENKDICRIKPDDFDYHVLYDYTNYFLNVGNFIVPLLENGFIKDVAIIDSTYSMAKLEKDIDFYDEVILDIDLDFFSLEMDYIDEDEKIELIKRSYEKAKIITICTSPYFIDFERAKKKLEKILKNCIR